MTETNQKPLVGFIGQGYVGKHMADAIEKQGFELVRYALEEPYRQNKDRIQDCDIVFICVPTPTTKKGFDASIVENSLKLVGKGKTAVIKSTILPGLTRTFQKKFPKLFVMHAPEFLVAAKAKEGAEKPDRNIVGIPKNSPAYIERAKQVLAVLPPAPFERIVSSEDAEVAKYGANFFLYLKVIYANLMYEVADSAGADYDNVREIIGTDERIGHSHLQIKHDSGHKGAKPGRGAGGLCFIKDSEALRRFYASKVRNPHGAKMLDAIIKKNIDLLASSGKDMDLLMSTYGAAVAKKKKRR